MDTVLDNIEPILTFLYENLMFDRLHAKYEKIYPNSVTRAHPHHNFSQVRNIILKFLTGKKLQYWQHVKQTVNLTDHNRLGYKFSNISVHNSIKLLTL